MELIYAVVDADEVDVLAAVATPIAIERAA
jgi:hypothetical protein